MFGKKNDRYADLIIVGEEQVSLSDLKKKAKRANRQFWGMSASAVLVSSMVLPYMSYAAAVADSGSSQVFSSSIVAPGYSMGGVLLSAYGVDMNDWGKISKDSAVQSNYGVWSGRRGDNAQKKLNSSSDVQLLDAETSGNLNLTDKEKSEGWHLITGRAGYSVSNPDGLETDNGNQVDEVAPYRTMSDYNYWASQLPTSSSSSSADVNVTLYADFVVLSLDHTAKRAVALSNPDDVAEASQAGKVLTGSSSTSLTVSQAIPYYVPLSAIFDAFDLKDPSDASISKLLEEIASDPDTAAGRLYTAAVDNNLLNGTQYTSKNGTGEISNAWNPYPYTMVFSKTSKTGKIVSSMYENSEAYVYFSPSSAYTQYMLLKAEYNEIRDDQAKNLELGKPHDPATVFQLGYYLAEMAILEAYLDESLPQDMTRGYVGATQPRSLTNGVAGDAIAPNLGDGGSAVETITNDDNSMLQKQTYAAIMYDVAKHVGTPDQAPWRQAELNAIMDTLSVFGYQPSAGSPKTGVMKGLEASSDCADSKGILSMNNYAATSRHKVFSRTTVFSTFQKYEKDVPQQSLTPDQQEDMIGAGVYTPTYYPIQQHKLPDAEKTYRFQIVGNLPYETLLKLIKDKQFATSVKFIYSTEDKDKLESFTTISEARQTYRLLAEQYEYAEEKGKEYGNSTDLGTYTHKDLIGSLSALGGRSIVSDQDGGSDSHNADSTGIDVTLQRIDAALLGYEASSMNSDNVHDLFDIVRSTVGLKYETFYRFYNPLKSEGGDNDLFLTRVSPALTTYFPAVLVNGYVPAGGDSITTGLSPLNVSFDYFAFPSFAPCFAAHTADDSYYGVLNYELRTFYSSGFTKSLSDSANVPAVGAYEELKAALNKMETEQAQEGITIDKNLAALYVMGKRLAYMNTVKYICANKTWSGDSIISWANSKNVDMSNESARNDLQNRLNELDRTLYDQGYLNSDGTPNMSVAGNELFRDDYDNIVKEKTEIQSKLDGTSGDAYQRLAGKNWVASNIKSLSDVKALGDLDGAVLESQNNDTRGHLASGSSANPFSSTSIWDGNGSADLPTLKNQQNESETQSVQADVLFTMLYDQELEKILGEGGTYYWEPMQSIKDMMNNNGVTPSVSEGAPEYDKAENNIYSVYFKGSLWQHFANALDSPGGKLFIAGASVAIGTATSGIWGVATAAAALYGVENANQDFSDQELAEAYTAQMDACAANLGLAIENIAKDAKLLTNAMPTKMQNCLAWADYQNMSDSSNQYQQDPSEANVTINVTASDESSEYDATKIKKADDLKKYGMRFGTNEKGEPAVFPDSSDDEDSDMEGRLQRGVEGTSSTYTNQPAIYTMSATISRVNKLASTSSTDYPYSGLANGRLQSGTDHYAILQAHVIDYSSLASDIEGDLSTRQRSKVVTLVEPQYSSLTDFFDNIGNMGAMFGEMASAMVKESSNAFSSVSATSASTKAITSSGATTSSAINGATADAAPVSYELSDGTVMNRTPASLGTFNPETGKIEYLSAISYENGYGSASSALAASSAASTTTGLAKLMIGPFSGIYAMLQVIGLILVLVFIGFIAFRNFYAYAIQSDYQMITAQTQLKTVMWRAVIAVFMIGLPPLAGGQGFEGGNFILLQIISNVVSYIADIFNSTNGAAIWNIFNIDFLATFGWNIALWLLYFACCLIISLCFGLGCVLLFFQSLTLLIFYAVGPIVWAFYVWPYNSQTNPAKDKKGGVTQRMGMSLYSGGEVGNMAPYGHVTNFTIIAGLSIMWAVMFWIIGQVFIVGSGITYTDGFLADAATTYSQNAESQAFSPVLLIGMFFGASWGGSAGPVAALRMVFTTVVCVILFIILFIMMVKAFKRVTKDQRGIMAGTAHGIKEGVKTIGKGAATAGKAVANGLDTARNAAHMVDNAAKMAKGLGVDTGKIADSAKAVLGAKGMDAKKEMAKKFLGGENAPSLGKLRQQMKSIDKNGVPADLAQRLKDEGMEVTPKAAKKLAKEDLKKELGNAGGLIGNLRDSAVAQGAMKGLATAKERGVAGLMSDFGMLDEKGLPNKAAMKGLDFVANVSKALTDSKNGAELLGTMGNLATGFQAKNLHHQAVAEGAKAKTLESAKGLVDKIASGDINAKNMHAKLDENSFKALKAAGLVTGDANDRSSWGLVSGAQKEEAGHQQMIDKAKGSLDQSIKKCLDKKQEIENTRKQAIAGAKSLGASAKTADAIDSGNRLMDERRVEDIIEQMHFVDDENGTAKEKAYAYLNKADARHKFDTEADQIKTMQQLENLSYDEAKKRIESMGCIKDLSRIGENTKVGKAQKIYDDVAQKCIDGLPAEFSKPSNAGQAAEAIARSFGTEVPSNVEFAKLKKRVAAGENLSQHDKWKYAAGLSYEKLMGTEVPIVSSPSLAETSVAFNDMVKKPVSADEIAKNAISVNGGKMEISPVALKASANMREEGSAQGVIDNLKDILSSNDEISETMASELMSQLELGTEDAPVGKMTGEAALKQIVKKFNDPKFVKEVATATDVHGMSDARAFAIARNVLSEMIAPSFDGYIKEQAENLSLAAQIADSASKTAESGQALTTQIAVDYGIDNVIVKSMQAHPEMNSIELIDMVEGMSNVDEGMKQHVLQSIREKLPEACKMPEVLSQVAENLTMHDAVVAFREGKLYDEKSVGDMFLMHSDGADPRIAFKMQSPEIYHYVQGIDLIPVVGEMGDNVIYTPELSESVNAMLKGGPKMFDAQYTIEVNKHEQILQRCAMQCIPDNVEGAEQKRAELVELLKVDPQTLMDASSDLSSIDVEAHSRLLEALGDKINQVPALVNSLTNTLATSAYKDASPEMQAYLVNYVKLIAQNSRLMEAEEHFKKAETAHMVTTHIFEENGPLIDPLHGLSGAQQHRYMQDRNLTGEQLTVEREVGTHDVSGTPMFEKDPHYSYGSVSRTSSSSRGSAASRGKRSGAKAKATFPVSSDSGAGRVAGAKSAGRKSLNDSKATGSTVSDSGSSKSSAQRRTRKRQ